MVDVIYIWMIQNKTSCKQKQLVVCIKFCYCSIISLFQLMFCSLEHFAVSAARIGVCMHVLDIFFGYYIHLQD
ncbi:hypothetical protein VNO77_06142 [Canavalia gladiata]|uniref:Uncharacterized protein n=1 Tax=Canavalia gladiata TaxID=3824 RepID=A0AAN9M6B6_CANGL